MPVNPLHPEAEPEEEEDLTSRTDVRRKQQESETALMALAETLVGLSDKMRYALELSEEMIRVIEETRRITNPSARYRSLRLVRAELRDGDAAAIEKRLLYLRDPSKGPAARAIEVWRTRVVDGGDKEIDAFVEAFPTADRQRLRQLARNVRKATESARTESLRVLTKALREHVR